MERVVAIVGPTAVGKSKLAVALAQQLKGEIVSADSMQVYRYMDIGTAKIRPEEMGGVPHHLISIVDPMEKFSVAQYQELAHQKISEINARGNLPFLVGGTGLYIKAVIDDYNFSEPAGDAGVRGRLCNEVKKYGSVALHQRLREVDPRAAERIHPNDSRRIVRALEVYLTTGKPITVWEEERKNRSPRYNFIMIGLNIKRERLYKRIESRVDQMLEEGLVAEVKNLLDRGLSNVAKQALGYKEIIDYLDGRCSLAESVRRIKRETRRYAKRQLTWFRNDPRVVWFNWEDYPSAQDMVAQVKNTIEGYLKKSEN